MSEREEPTRAALIYTALPDAEAARAIAGTLLDERVIACANIIGPMEAVFAWEGKIQSANEVGVLFKTTAATMSRALARLGELHPYDTPAIVANICDGVHPQTLSWLAEQVS